MTVVRKKLFGVSFVVTLLALCVVLFMRGNMPKGPDGLSKNTLHDSADLDWQQPGQWVVVSYWASWCSYCKHEVPELNDLSSLGVKVIGISAVPVKQAEVEAWRAVAHATYPLLKAAPEALTRRVGRVDRLPTTYLINPEGAFIGPFVGSVTKAELQKHMK